MKIAIDVSPLETGHRVRGVGFYLKNLKEALNQYFPSNSYTYFTQTQNIPNNTELIHYPYFDPFFLTLPLIKKKKTVVTVHDLTPFVLPSLFPIGIKGKLKWILQKKSLRAVDAVITDSQSSKNDIARIAQIPLEKIYVAYLAPGKQFKRVSDREKIADIKAKYSLPDQFILYVGDVTANKNLPRLVKAAIDIKASLVMVGKALVNEEYDKSNPWNKDLVEVQQLAKENPSIIRLGFVPDEDLVALYTMATVFAMPSLYEGFGLPIVEAMSCGCPVLASDKGSLKEVAGDAVEIVDPYFLEDIVRGLKNIIKDEKFQKSLSEKGLRQIEKFSWKQTAEETVAVYKKVLHIE